MAQGPFTPPSDTRRWCIDQAIRLAGLNLDGHNLPTAAQVVTDAQTFLDFLVGKETEPAPEGAAES